LGLILGWAGKGDLEVVEAGLRSWDDVLQRYVDTTTLVYYDPLIDWMFTRTEEIIDRFASESVGLLLPIAITATERLGRTTANHVNPLNRDHDEGTYRAVRALVLAVTTTANAHRYSA